MSKLKITIEPIVTYKPSYKYLSFGRRDKPHTGSCGMTCKQDTAKWARMRTVTEMTCGSWARRTAGPCTMSQVVVQNCSFFPIRSFRLIEKLKENVQVWIQEISNERPSNKLIMQFNAFPLEKLYKRNDQMGNGTNLHIVSLSGLVETSEEATKSRS